MTRVRDAVLLLLALALGLRLASWLVEPALKLIVGLWVLVAIYTFLFVWRR